MPIEIGRVDDGDVAVVTRTEHMPVSWSSPGALSWRELTDRLLELGFHLQDITDAFYAADPDCAVLNAADQII